MVIALARSLAAAAGPLMVAADEAARAQPLLMRLDPQSRAKVLMTLFALVLVGVGLVALAVVGGRRALRIARRSHGPTPRHEDAWFRKPLAEEPDRRPPARGDTE